MTNRILVGAVFLMGCAVGGASSQLVVPRASAQQAATLTQWEFHCTGPLISADYKNLINQLGEQGWEAFSVDHGEPGEEWCFKRPKM